MPSVATGWHNPCGGVRWRTLRDGRIEVEDRGVLYATGEGPYSFRTYVHNSWRNFRPEILAASKKRGVPVSWILALIATETGLWSNKRERQARISNYCCRGPMAVMVSPYPNHKTFGGYPRADDMLDPAKNIDTGAAIMAYHARKGLDLPAIAARYNSGGLCCRSSPTVPSKPGGRVQNVYNLCSAKIPSTATGQSYPEKAIRGNNTAIAELDVNATAGSTLLYAVGGFLLVGAAAVAVGAVPLGKS